MKGIAELFQILYLSRNCESRNTGTRNRSERGTEIRCKVCHDNVHAHYVKVHIVHYVKVHIVKGATVKSTLAVRRFRCKLGPFVCECVTFEQ